MSTWFDVHFGMSQISKAISNRVLCLSLTYLMSGLSKWWMLQVRYDFFFLWNFAHLIFIFTRSANWNVISPVQVFSISSIVRQVDKFSTRRGVGQLKLFVITVTIFLFSRFFFYLVNWQMFHRFSITNNAVLSEFNWKTTILKGGNKRPFKDLKICLVLQVW